MKLQSEVLLLAALAGCSHYSPGGDIKEVGAKGYTVRCDAVPNNQPGCYTPPPSLKWWADDKIKFEFGAR